MKRLFLISLFALCVIGCTDPDPEEAEIEEKERLAEEVLEQVDPVISDYVDNMRSKNVQALYNNYSSEYHSQFKYEDFSKHWSQNADKYSAIAQSIRVGWIKPHEIYAIAQLKSMQGTEYIALIREDNNWKIHRASQNLSLLLRSLQ